MLDNYTTDQFFEGVDHYDDLFNGFASMNGRIAIIDNADLEKVYDQYVQMRAILISEYIKWR